MDQELQLWDDTRSQVIQFYIAKLFRRGNQNKTKLLYHFRIGQIDPETNSLKSVMEILNRESHLEDWDSFARKLRDIVIGRCENACFAPREKDIALTMDRILATPQIETTLNIDGVAYLLRTPEITGHIDLSIRFWTTADLLRKFQLKLQQILQNREFRSNVELLPEITLSTIYDEDEEADESDDEEESEKETATAPEVVKKTKLDTEMLIKVEESVDEDDSVEVEDWEEEDIDEFGGDESEESKKSPEIAENSNDKKVVKIQTDKVPVDTEIKDKKIIILETKSDSTPETKSSEKTPDESTLFDADAVKPMDEKLPTKTDEPKTEEVSDADAIENEEKDEKSTLKRRPRTPKNPVEDNNTDAKSDTEKKGDEKPKKAPKKSVRAKKATADKKGAEKKTPAKKTPAKKAAKKPAAKKPKKTKKDTEEKKTDADDK